MLMVGSDVSQKQRRHDDEQAQPGRAPERIEQAVAEPGLELLGRADQTVALPGAPGPGAVSPAGGRDEGRRPHRRDALARPPRAPCRTGTGAEAAVSPGTWKRAPQAGQRPTRPGTAPAACRRLPQAQTTMVTGLRDSLKPVSRRCVSHTLRRGRAQGLQEGHDGLR